jgi:AraC family transcriptional regulator
VCNIHQLSNKAYQFDGFTFYNSWEEPNDWRMHSHEEIQITLPQVNTRALIDYESSSSQHRTQQIRVGEAFLISPHQEHTLDWQKKAELTLFYLHPLFFANTVNESIGNKQLKINNCFKIIDDLVIREVGSIFRNLCSLGLDTEKLYLENLANLLAVHLLKNYLSYDLKDFNNAPGLSIRKFNLIVEYIEANLSEKITLTDLAKVVNLGKFYFSHSFKNHTNMTPYDYVLQLRVKRAKRLLQSSDLPICDVALECGFGNQSHLAKHFRQKLGITPMNYRKNA